MNKKREAKQDSFKPIFDRIECDTGLIVVDTPEETRLIREIYRKYKDLGSIQFWSIGQGLHEIDKRKVPVDRFYPHKFPSANARSGKNNLDTRTLPLNTFTVIEEDCRDKIKPDEAPDRKHIYVLRDLDKFWKDPVIVRRLKDLVYLCTTASSTLITTGNGIVVPQDLEKDAVFIKLKYPTREEVLDMIADTRDQIESHNKSCKPENKIDDSFIDDDIARACVGLTEDQIINTLQYTMTIDNKVNIEKILEEKKSIINKSDILEYWTSHDTLNDIGGFGEIKDWFEVKKTIIKNAEKSEKFKAESPKGIMLLGVQGSGKTAIARALAQSWNVGLIKLDMGKVFAGLVGESVSPDTEFCFYDELGNMTRIRAEDAYNQRSNLLGHITTQSFTRDGEVQLKEVNDIVRHNRTKNLVRIITKSGRSIDVTEDHSLFTISDSGKLIELEPNKMKPGVPIAVPCNYDNKILQSLAQDHPPSIDILDLIRTEKDEDKWLLINPIEQLGEILFKITSPKSHKQYREGRPLNLKLIPSSIKLNVNAKIKAKMTDREYPIILPISNNLAELFGWYTAEGSTTGDRLRLHVNRSETMVVEELIKKCGYDCYHYQDKDSNGETIFFGDTGLKRIFDYVYLTNKERIPTWMFEMTTSCRQSYIKGLFSGDGGISGEHIELSQSRKGLCKDILDLLSSIGIFASLYPRIDGGSRIIIHSSIFKKKYMAEVGFTQEAKEDLLEDLFEDNDWGHKIPFYKDLKASTSAHFVNLDSDWISYRNAIKINPNLKDSDVYWDSVKSIEVLEDQPEYVYDISVPSNQNFIAGGIICHNSEKRMRQATSQIDAAGGIVVIDELDKGLSGAGSSDKTDGGTTNRVIGTLLTWLNEDHPGVFLICTANDITNLRRNHPELLRKGRFDEIWFSDIPNVEERKEIFSIHLRKRGRDPSKFDLAKLAEYEYEDSDGQRFAPTGAEIESSIKDAIQNCLAKAILDGAKDIEIGSKHDIETDDVMHTLKIIKPITKVARETIATMRRWSDENARNVSKGLPKDVKKKASRVKLNMRETIDTNDVSL